MAQVSKDDVNSTTAGPQLPAVAAAFLVSFDNRKGYTLTWHRSLDQVKLEGTVEFKSLPSGLHNVKEDLVYFVHQEYSGISAFIRQDDSEAARNARMLAVGVLVPEVGRTGKSFLYAQELRSLSRILIDKPGHYEPLEAFWEKHKLNENTDQPQQEEQSPTGYQKPRALSISTTVSGGFQHALPAHHPALTLPELLTSFGPVLFPVVRGALLHKRILVLGEAPVELMCNMVYNLSILSTLSRATEGLLPPSSKSMPKPRPLFNIGIADIPFLESLTHPWIACTTDDVLATKPHLFELLVILPNSTTSQKVGNQTYPKVVRSTPELARALPKNSVKATQRDARRFVGLKQSMSTLDSGVEVENLPLEEADGESTRSEDSVIIDRHEAVEPLPWSVVAYTSLIWWASAGDRRSGLTEAEDLANEQDEAFLHDILTEASPTREVAIVAYFHKLSALLFSVLSNAVSKSQRGADRYHDGADGSDDEGDNQALIESTQDEDGKCIEVSEEDVRTMGLDIWSQSDQQFTSQIVKHWWKRDAVVESGSIECCGIKII